MSLCVCKVRKKLFDLWQNLIPQLKMNQKKILFKIHSFLTHWQQQVTKKQFMFLLSVVVGLSAGLAAVLLKMAVHTVFNIAMHHKFAGNYNVLLLFPLLGLGLTYLIIQKGLGGKLTKGLAPLHFAIAQNNSILPSEQTYAQLVTSPITVGFGGSAGLEAPIVITGAALGANFADYFRLSYAERTLLLACGVAAGIASAFNAPIAGVLFTIEVLMLDISTTGFIPLLIAAASGALLSKIILQEGTILSFHLQAPFHPQNVPFYILLGLLSGLLSVYHARMFVKIEHFCSHWHPNPYFRMLFAGWILALLMLFFPSLFGEGYSSIKSLAQMQPNDLFQQSLLHQFITNDWILLLCVGLVMFFKAIATAVTLGGGGNGGNFAPSLFVGSYLGFLYAKFINQLNISQLPVSNFTIVGMAGLLSGLYHAPLTAIFLIAELTGGYSLMIPLMLVTSISYLVSKTMEPHTMDTKRLAMNRKIRSGDKDANILVTMQVSTLIETNFVRLHDTDHLEQLIHAITISERNLFPVVDKQNKLLGIIILSDVKAIIFKKELYRRIKIKELVKPYPDVIRITDDMTTIVEKFETTQAWNLPVISEDGYVGFISKSKLFSAYRTELIQRTIR
jgi:chloride channel protein, CIC family